MNQSTMNQASNTELSLDERMDVFLSKYKKLMNRLYKLDIGGASKKKKQRIKDKILELIEDEIFHEEETEKERERWRGEDPDARCEWIDKLYYILDKLTS